MKKINLLLAITAISCISLSGCKKKDKNKSNQQETPADQQVTPPGDDTPPAPQKENFGDITLTSFEYFFDEVKPTPVSTNVPEGTTISYKYYLNAESKLTYVPGGANEIVPNVYTLEATYEKTNYNTLVKTCSMTVKAAVFDEAYALSAATFDVGQTDVGFNINEVNPGLHISMQDATTHENIEGVTFTWKESYVLTPGDTLEAIILAHKDNFEDKEFNITVTGTKKQVQIPTIAKLDSEELPEFIYDGTQKEIRKVNFDADRVNIIVNEDRATNAGTYHMEFALKDPTYTCWSDTTVGNKSYSWTISKGDMSTISMHTADYYYDEVKPTPVSSNVPEGTEISYKYYQVSAEKFDYVPGEQNDIIPGGYTLEATYTNPNYETVVKTYGMVVLSAQFDAAYALSASTINVGETDIGFDINAVDPGTYISMQNATTHENIAGVTFTWKQDYDLNPGTELNATIVAHKQYFVDKEYDITVTGTKKSIQIPTLVAHDTSYEPDFYYDGSEKQVDPANFDSDYVDIVTNEDRATNAGTYTMEFALKDPVNTCWSDSTTANKTCQWTIDKANPAGASTGYQLLIGDYKTGAGNTVVSIDKTVLAGENLLSYQFRNSSYVFENYADATFEVTTPGVAHITDGKLIIDDFTADKVTIVVNTSNPNHEFDQPYDIKIVDKVSDTNRTLTFDAGQHTSYYGLDPANILGFSPDYAGGYVAKFTLHGSGFRLDKQFKSINSVSLKLKWVSGDEPTSSFSTSVWLSLNTSYISDPSDIVRNKNVDPATYEEGTDVTYDFSTAEPDPAEDYYLEFWFGGSTGPNVYVTELSINYTIS